MPPPHMRTHENTLWILCQPVSPCSSTTVRVNWVEARKAVHTSRAESERDGERQHGDGRGGRGERAPAPARRQHQRDQQAELRLVGEQAEQDAGEPRPPIELSKRAAEQRGGEEAVMAVAEIDEHGGEGEREQEP